MKRLKVKRLEKVLDEGQKSKQGVQLDVCNYAR